MFGMVQTPAVNIAVIPVYQQRFQELMAVTPELQQPPAQMNGFNVLAPFPIPAAALVKREQAGIPNPAGGFAEVPLQSLRFAITSKNFIPLLTLIAQLSGNRNNDLLVSALLDPCVACLEIVVSNTPDVKNKIELYRSMAYVMFRRGRLFRYLPQDQHDGVEESFNQALNYYNHSCDYAAKAVQLCQTSCCANTIYAVDCLLTLAEAQVASIKSDVRREKRYQRAEVLSYLSQANQLISSFSQQAFGSKDREHIGKLLDCHNRLYAEFF